MLDFSPAAQPASWWQRIRAHALTEGGIILRNGEQLVLSMVIPITLLLAGRWFAARLGQPFEVTAPSVFALAVWSAGFTSLAIATGFERRYRVTERMAATPLGKSGIVAGKMGAIFLVILVQLSVLVAIALLLGWHPELPVALVGLAAITLALPAFAGLALALAGTLKAEVTLALANLIYLLGMLGGGIMFPVASYPAWARPVVSLLPTAALGEALRFGSLGSLVVLAVWALSAGLLARKVFSWVS